MTRETNTSTEAMEPRIHNATCHLKGLLNGGGRTIYGEWLVDLIDLLPVLAARLAKAEAELGTFKAALEDIAEGEPEHPDDPPYEWQWCKDRAAEALALIDQPADAMSELQRMGQEWDAAAPNYEKRPFAHCCNASVEICDCVDPDHGTAFFLTAPAPEVTVPHIDAAGNYGWRTPAGKGTE